MTKITLMVLSVLCYIGSALAMAEISRDFKQSQIQSLFMKFKLEFNKRYASYGEEYRRFNIFSENIQLIVSLNEEEEGTAEYGLTQYSDLTPSEFSSKILMASQPPQNFTEDRFLPVKEQFVSLPESFDWRELGAVTPVKDQGTVGTCWTFSTTGNIEGQWFLAGNPLVSLSEEQIVDCDGSQQPSTGHADCGVFGGWPSLAFDYVINAGGLPSEADYPYCCGTGKCYPCPAVGYNETLCGPPVSYCNATAYPCRQGTLPIAATIESWAAISTDEDVIQQQLTEIGPLSVALDASKLQFYKKGVFAPKYCSTTELNHAVLMVGYGVDSATGVEYWTIKNSWGVKWGEQGYFRIQRGTGKCGINTQVATSLVNSSSVSSKQFSGSN